MVNRISIYYMVYFKKAAFNASIFGRKQQYLVSENSDFRFCFQMKTSTDSQFVFLTALFTSKIWRTIHFNENLNCDLFQRILEIWPSSSHLMRLSQETIFRTDTLVWFASFEFGLKWNNLFVLFMQLNVSNKKFNRINNHVRQGRSS